MKPSTIIAMILSFSVFCAGATLLVHNHLQELNQESRSYTLYEYDLGQKETPSQTNPETASETETSSALQSWIRAHITSRNSSSRLTLTLPDTTTVSDIIVVPDVPSEVSSATTESTTESTTKNTTASTTESTTESATESTTESTTESQTNPTDPDPETPKYYYLIEDDTKIFHWIGATNLYENGRVPDGYTVYYGTYGDLVEQGYTPCPSCFP